MKGRAVGDFLRLCLLPMAMETFSYCQVLPVTTGTEHLGFAQFFQHFHAREVTSRLGVAKHTQA